MAITATLFAGIHRIAKISSANSFEPSSIFLRVNARARRHQLLKVSSEMQFLSNHLRNDIRVCTLPYTSYFATLMVLITV